MGNGTKTRTEGKMDEMKGRAQEAYGDLTGDEDTQAEGQANQAQGKAEQVVGDMNRQSKT